MVGGRNGAMGGRLPGKRPGCAEAGDSKKPSANAEKMPTMAKRT
ncbi:hypothetical protein VT84_29310 [Gemmata sp. SH-PL17]|nr:hypothetical protein VT84_29310 [Gemmata sp. SH-PL17]